MLIATDARPTLGNRAGHARRDAMPLATAWRRPDRFTLTGVVARMALATVGVFAVACTTPSSGGAGGGGGGGWTFGDSADPATDAAAGLADVGAVEDDTAGTPAEDVEADNRDGDEAQADVGSNDVAPALDTVDPVDEDVVTGEDVITTPPEDAGGDPDVVVLPEVGEASLHGLVLDVENLPIPGVTVTFVESGNTGLTDGAGHFELNKIPQFSAARIRFEKKGYATLERPVALLSKETSMVRVRLLERGPSEAVSAKYGGVAHHVRGGVQFKPGTLVDSAGKPFSGEALVDLTHLDPSTNQIDAAPGNFMAVDAMGTMSMLESFAMAEVRMRDAAGKPLALAPGKTARVDLDLPVNTNLKLGDKVPMWHYDGAKKLWLEEGTSTVVQSTRDPKRLAMVADVGHFSWWNCDQAGNARCISGKVTGCTGQPLAGVTIEAKGQGANVQDGDSTKASGAYCVMGFLGQPTTVVYRLGNRIAQEVSVLPTGGGSFCGGSCMSQPDVQVCFDGCTRGTIADSAGKPVAGAQIFVPAKSSGASVTDPAAFSGDDGSYALDSLSLDPMELTILRPGYLPGKLETVPVKGNVADGTCAKAPDVVTLAQPCLSGSVEGPDGKPLAGAIVSFEPYGKLPSSVPAVTGEDGIYTLAVALGALGKLKVEAADTWPWSKAVKITADGACSPEAAQVVPPVRLTPWGCLQGVVQDAAGKGLAGIQVAGGAKGGSQSVISGADGTFCMEGPVGEPMVLGGSGKGLAGTVQTVTIGKGGICGGESCALTPVELVMKPTVFDHLEGFWKDCQTVLGDVQVSDLQVQGTAQGLEQVQGMHAIGMQEPDGTRRIAIVLSDAAGPAVLGKGKSLWVAEVAIGPYDTADVVTINLPPLDPAAPNAFTRMRGQIISKTGGELGIDASLYRLADDAPSTLTVVFGDKGAAAAAEGFFDLTFSSACGVGSGQARVKGSFVVHTMLQLPLVDQAAAETVAWQSCYDGYDSPEFWNANVIGRVDALSVGGQAKSVVGASGTVIYAARDKGLPGDAAQPGAGLALVHSGGGVTVQAHLPALGIGANSLGLKSFCGGLGFLPCCSGTPEQPVSLTCGSGNVEANVGGCKTFGVPACPAEIGGATMTLTNGSCAWKLEPEDGNVSLAGVGFSPLEGGLTGTFQAKLTKLTSGNPAVCKATDVEIAFTAATCKEAPATGLGFQHAKDPAP